MIDESARKALALAHCERVNARDVAGLLRLYAPRVCFEDPVGFGARVGHDALRAHVNGAIAGEVYEAAGEPVAAEDGMHAAVPVVATMRYLPNGPLLAKLGIVTPPSSGAETKRMVFNYVMVIRVGADGLIEDMRAYWGRSDVVVVD